MNDANKEVTVTQQGVLVPKLTENIVYVEDF